MRVRISRALLDRIQDEARAAAPAECCGLLLGERETIHDAISVYNAAPDPIAGFEIDPVTHIAAQKAARKRGLRIVGHYHSHPSGDSSPSLADAARAGAGALWLILTGREAALWAERAGGRVHGRFDPAPLAVFDPPPCNDLAEAPIGAE